MADIYLLNPSWIHWSRNLAQSGEIGTSPDQQLPHEVCRQQRTAPISSPALRRTGLTGEVLSALTHVTIRMNRGQETSYQMGLQSPLRESQGRFWAHLWSNTGPAEVSGLRWMRPWPQWALNCISRRICRSVAPTISALCLPKWVVNQA